MLAEKSLAPNGFKKHEYLDYLVLITFKKFHLSISIDYLDISNFLPENIEKLSIIKLLSCECLLTFVYVFFFCVDN